jgi:hypothetical protein
MKAKVEKTAKQIEWEKAMMADGAVHANEVPHEALALLLSLDLRDVCREIGLEKFRTLLARAASERARHDTDFVYAIFADAGVIPEADLEAHGLPTMSCYRTEVPEVIRTDGYTAVRIEGNVISVYHPRTKYSRPKGAEVNWPAIGSVVPERARAFAEALLKAADIAEELNAK